VAEQPVASQVLSSVELVSDKFSSVYTNFFFCFCVFIVRPRIGIVQLLVPIAMHYQALTQCMNVSFVLVQE
jgi:hypothetical protein